MDFITDKIAIGNKRDLLNPRKLQKEGIEAVLNLAIHLDANMFPEDKSMQKSDHFPLDYNKVGMYDSDNNRPETLMAAVLILEQLLERHEKVLVNCRAGASRSVTTVCLYLVKNEGMTFDEALALVKSKRERANPNPGLRKLAEEVVARWSKG